MKALKIAVIAGDGVGPEIITQVERITDLLNRQLNSNIELVKFSYGAEYYLKTKISVPEEFLDQISLNYNAILLGPLGDPRIPDQAHAREIIYRLRDRLNLILNIHPVKLYRSWLSSIKDAEIKNINLYIIRENVENADPMKEEFFNDGKDTELLLQTNVITRRNANAFLKSSLQFTSQRNMTKVCFCDQRTILPKSHLLWRSLTDALHDEFPDIEINYKIPASVIRELIENPDDFEVILTPGNTGEMLSTLATVITGGFGLFYSIETNPELISVYRIRQSASIKYAGHNTANPLGAILAFKNILDDQNFTEEAKLLGEAISNNFENHLVTIDLGGIIGTAEVGDYICDYMMKKSEGDI